nr:MAG TPA: Spore coat protein H kinase fold, STRUCTURAL PROTEIN [Crassvirales sp.]
MINNKKYVDDVGIKTFANKVKEKNTKQDESIDSLNNRSTQMEETIKSIAATGGASQATAVTYDNKKSKLASINIQGAVDEVVDKTSIKDEEGTIIETPFRYIQNEEFIFAKVDAEEKLLFGIQWDGTPVFGKTSAVEDRLQTQVNLLADKVTAILGDDNTTSAIDTLKELKDFFAGIDNTQTLTSILANLNAAIYKVAIKDEAGEIQDTPFRVISNDEFLLAVVDSEDRVLYGIYRDTGKPYYPLNDMYHVEQNEEFFAVWHDAANHVLLGIRRDGQIIGEIHAVNALKQVISQLQSDLASLQEKVGTIDTNLKELLDVFSLQENPEYLAVEKDADGRVLSATYNDGSHYIHNAKSETIPTEFEHIEDPEGRTEITTDAEDKILGYRDSEGTRHEHKISASHINLSDEAAKEVNEAFKSAGIKMENPSDFSKDSHIELPIPRIAAQVRIYAPKLPTTKQDDIEAVIEYNDKDGNYFRKPVILNAQGSSSMAYYVKNMAIDIADGSEIKFGDFPTQDSFHLKKYYIDAFRGQCVVGYWLMEQVYKSRPVGQQYPYEYSYSNKSTTDSFGNVKKDFFTGSKCHPDGFPIIITWIDTNTQKETWMGIYAWNLKKSKEVYNVDKKDGNQIILDGTIDRDTLFGGTVNWSAFEIRNPKSLIDINGNKYDGDNPKELSESDPLSKKVKDNILRLSHFVSDITQNYNLKTFEKYFIVPSFIDYYLVSQVLYHLDGFRKNWIWGTWDGQHWTPTLYDVDSIFGAFWNGTHIVVGSDTSIVVGGSCLELTEICKSQIKERYYALRKAGIFTSENITSLLKTWLNSIGFDNIQKEFKTYNETPSYRNNNISEEWDFVSKSDSSDTFSESKQYAQDETCVYMGYKFRAKQITQGVFPLSKLYDKVPRAMGFFNSIGRVSNWVNNRIKFLDTEFEYK